MKKLLILILSWSLLSCGNTKTVYKGKFDDRRIEIIRGNFRGLSYYKIKLFIPQVLTEYEVSLFSTVPADMNNIGGYAIQKSIYRNGHYEYTLVGMRNACADTEQLCEAVSEKEKKFLGFAAKIISEKNRSTKFTTSSVNNIAAWHKR
jgi:hypothetical protein